MFSDFEQFGGSYHNMIVIFGQLFGHSHLEYLIVRIIHFRILEERKINWEHPILVRCVNELTAFPLVKPAFAQKTLGGSVNGQQQQLQVRSPEFSTPQMTSFQHLSLHHESKSPYSMEIPLEQSLREESPGRRYRDWDDFNLASWWDVESRRGRDYLETRESGVDFFTAVTDTTTSAYEETEDLEEDEEGEEGNVSPLLDSVAVTPGLTIKNGEEHLLGQSHGPECFQAFAANRNGIRSVSMKRWNLSTFIVPHYPFRRLMI